MRRLTPALLFLSVFVFAVAEPAHAGFWGWLDNLSGPGEFHSQQIELRLVCFGAASPLGEVPRSLAETQAAIDRYAANPTPEMLTAARAAWRNLSARFAAWTKLPPFIQPDQTTVSKMADFMRSTVAVEPDSARPALSGPSPILIKSLQDTVAALVDDARKPLSDQRMAANNVSAVGVLWSLCRESKFRRISIEMGVNFYHSFQSRTDWANGQQVNLTTFMPAISWHAIADPHYDVVDVGFGAGAYIATSSQFQRFSGLVLQPVRLDFHAPSQWSQYLTVPGSWKFLGGLATLVTYRYGFLLFPKGFEPNAFAGPGQQTPALPTELIRTGVVFVNLEPLARKLTW